MMKIFPNIHKAKAGRLSGRAATLQAGPASNRHAPSKEPGRRHFICDHSAKLLVAAMIENALEDAAHAVDHGLLDADVKPTPKARRAASNSMNANRGRAAGHGAKVAIETSGFWYSPLTVTLFEFVGLDLEPLRAVKAYLAKKGLTR